MPAAGEAGWQALRLIGVSSQPPIILLTSCWAALHDRLAGWVKEGGGADSGPEGCVSS